MLKRRFVIKYCIWAHGKYLWMKSGEQQKKAQVFKKRYYQNNNYKFTIFVLVTKTHQQNPHTARFQ